MLSTQHQKIHVSTLTGKLEDFKAISTDTTSNDFCNRMYRSKNKKIICTWCYSQNSLTGFRKNSVPALQRNSALLSEPLTELPFINSAFFRFDAHGELINTNNLINYLRIAEVNPHCNFALWTKRIDLVNEVFGDLGAVKPLNFILVYSNPIIDNVVSEVPNRYFDKIFNNVESTEATGDFMPCTGQKCKDCLNCYKHDGLTVIVEHVKK